MELMLLFFFPAVLGVIVWSVFFNKDAAVKRQIKNTTVFTSDEFPHIGQGRLHGSAHRYEKLLEAPLSGRPCVAWRVEIQERISSHDNPNYRWRNVLKKEEIIPFLVEDSMGKALVLADSRARMTLEQDAHFSSGSFNNAEPRMEAFLAAHGKSSKGLIFNKSMRYREGVLEEGEWVHVTGTRDLSRTDMLVLISNDEVIRFTDKHIS